MNTLRFRKALALFLVLTTFVVSIGVLGHPGIANAAPDAAGIAAATTQAECTTAEGVWTPADSTSDTGSVGTGSCAPPGASASKSAVCSGIADCIMWLPSALWHAVVTLLAGSLIYISTWVLAAAASLFNWLVDFTIIQFGGVYLSIKTAVETAWTAFRDIANIFIIGIFTYIAISIILGLKEFGQKKMIASVLIIAVLINFSLLFTKMIIDVSNYTAAQIYTAAALGSSTATQGSPVGSASTVPKYGIADQFMNLLGVGTFAGSFKTVNDTAQAKDGGWPLLHGILVMLVVLGAALVLFYGCFLLISRMIMLIFLMATASIAFASYLIPSWSSSKFGWTAWWDSLIWAATFAPMLMIFLWMTLNVSYALKGASKATLGAALSNPAGGDNIGALFTYVMVLGLLFTTFKLSSMWASKIGGFSWAAAPLTNAFRAAGLGMRLGVGLPMYFRAKSLTKDAQGLSDRAGIMDKAAKRHERLGNFGLADMTFAAAKKMKDDAASKMKSAGFANRLASSRFNLMDTAGAKAILGDAGIKGAAAGGSSKLSIEKSVADRIEARAKDAEKMAAKIAPSAERNEEAKREARRVVREQRQVQDAQLAATHTVAEEVAKTAKNNGRLVERLAEAENAQVEGVKKQTLSQAEFDAGRKPQAAHEADMRTEKANIERAATEAKKLRQQIAILDKPVNDAKEALDEYRKGTKKLTQEAEKDFVDAIRDSAIDISEKIGAKQGDIITRNTIGLLGENRAVADETKSLYKKKVKISSFRDAIKLTQEEEGGGGHTSAETEEEH